MLFPPLTQQNNSRRLPWLLRSLPATRVFSEYWLYDQLKQNGHPNPVQYLHWALIKGQLHLHGLAPGGAWMLSRRAAPASTSQPASLYERTTQFEMLPEGGAYPSLPNDVQEYLAAARFAYYENDDDSPKTYDTIWVMTRRWQLIARRFRETLATIGPHADRYTSSLPRAVFNAFPMNCRPGMPVALDALTISFDHHTKMDAVRDLLTSDLVLANYLLLIYHHPFKPQLTVVVRVPSGYANIAEAYEALPAYCRERLRARGCECQGGRAGEPVLLDFNQPFWLHPSLYPSTRRILLPN